MIGTTDLDRVMAANRYLVLATADENGQPWATPLFFAPAGPQALWWVSSSTSRHSCNITARPEVAITVFDSTVEIGRASAAFFDARAEAVFGPEADAGLQALNERLPEHKRLTAVHRQPAGPLVVYRADIRRRYLLVGGGNSEYGNEVDMTVEL